MRRFMISAMASGSGKTVITCGLMRAFARRGLSVAGFKCGPDYIDPMFHTRVLGIPSRNLDLFLQGEDGVRRTLFGAAGQDYSGSAGHNAAGQVVWTDAGYDAPDLAILEGAMGFYDGLGGTTEASAWETSAVTDTPVILVLRPKGQSITLAAQVKGLMEFRQPGRIAGLLLTDCRPGLAAHLKNVLERETGLPVLGALPPLAEAALESRHLGLVTAAEVEDLLGRVDVIAENLEKYADLSSIWEIAKEDNSAGVDMRTDLLQSADLLKTQELSLAPGAPSAKQAAGPRCRIAVARDPAFCFYYEDNLDALRRAGAELIFFSPMADGALPAADGLYLGGGYPELYLKELSQNESMRESIRRAVDGGMPTVAECGGFLYLQEAVRDNSGRAWPMAEALPGSGFGTGRLQRFGYLTLRAASDSMLFRAGEEIPAHEFHYWDSTDCGEGIEAVKRDGRHWQCGHISETLYAAFPHLHWGGALPMAERFAAAAALTRHTRLANES